MLANTQQCEPFFSKLELVHCSSNTVSKDLDKQFKTKIIRKKLHVQACFDLKMKPGCLRNIVSSQILF